MPCGRARSAALLPILLLVACSNDASPATEDTPATYLRAAESEIERALRDDHLTSQARVSCPDDVEWVAGQSFDCSVSGVSGSMGVTVEVVSEDGRFDWVADGLMPAPS